MKKTLHILSTDRFIFRLLLITMLCCFFCIGLYTWKRDSLPPQVPLFYSLPRGEEQLGTPVQLLFLPAASILIFILHSLLAGALYEKMKLASYLLILTAMIVSLILSITFVKIIFLVT